MVKRVVRELFTVTLPADKSKKTVLAFNTGTLLSASFLFVNADVELLSGVSGDAGFLYSKDQQLILSSADYSGLDADSHDEIVMRAATAEATTVQVQYVHREVV